MLRYILPGPKTLRTGLMLAALSLLASLTLAGSALAWLTPSTLTTSTSSGLNAAACVPTTAGDFTNPNSACYGWGTYTNTSGQALGAGIKIGAAGAKLGDYTFGSPNAVVRAAYCGTSGTCVQAGESNGHAIATGAGTLEPAGAVSSRINGISCTTLTSVQATCLAVGEWTNSSGKRGGYAIARAGTSTAWSVVYQTTGGSLTQYALTGVSCVLSRCYAVGTNAASNGNSSGSALVYSPATATISSVSLPATGTSTKLNAISCQEDPNTVGVPAKCVAVGSYKTSSASTTTLPLYLSNNAGVSPYGFSVLAGTPAPPTGATSTVLNGVGCYWKAGPGIRCRVVGDTDAYASFGSGRVAIQGSLTAWAGSGPAHSTATGTSCFTTNNNAWCADSGTVTPASGAPYAIFGYDNVDPA